jgi:hypothetical protein
MKKCLTSICPCCMYVGNQIYHSCSSRGPEEALYLFEVNRNPRWLSSPLIGRAIFSFLRFTVCKVGRHWTEVNFTGPNNKNWYYLSKYFLCSWHANPACEVIILEKGQLADGHTVIASLKPLGQLETTFVGMFIGWSSETVMFFCCCCLERYKRNNRPKVIFFRKSNFLYTTTLNYFFTNLQFFYFQKGELPYSYRLVSIVNHIGSSSIVGE